MPRRTTTVTEYDELGRVVKTTVTEEDVYTPYNPGGWLPSHYPIVTYCGTTHLREG